MLSTLPRTLHWRGGHSVLVSSQSLRTLWSVLTLLSFLASILFHPSNLQALPASHSVYRTADTSTFPEAKCNPYESSQPTDPSFLPGPPRGLNAICLDLNESNEPLRFYFYDANGALVRMEAASDGSTEFEAVYDVNRKPKRITDSRTGTTESIYFYTATGEQVAVVEDGSRQELEFDAIVRFDNSNPIYRYNGDVETEETDGIWRFFVRDHLDNPMMEITSDETLARKDYLPFGQTFYNVAEVDSSRTLFNGKRRESSVLDFHARHYDPSTERFLQADSELPDGLRPLGYNRYLFTYGNPVVHSDPTGEFPVLAAVLIGALVSTIANADQIDNFGDFATFAVAGGLVGLAPGLGQALGGGILGSMVAGAATNLASVAVASTAYPGVLSGDAALASALAGAASGAVTGKFSQLPEDLGGTQSAVASGFSNASQRASSEFVYSSFGYGSSNGGLGMAANFFSGVANVGAAKLPGGPLLGFGIGMGAAYIASGGDLDNSATGTAILSGAMTTLMHVANRAGRADVSGKGEYADFPKDPKARSRWYARKGLNESWQKHTGLNKFVRKNNLPTSLTFSVGGN